MKLTEEIQATAELCGSALSAPALAICAEELISRKPQQVYAALARCRREIRGRLTLADVLTRLDDGHLGADEAWAMMPRNEDVTVVWTREMAKAWGIAKPLLDAGETIAARMSFREAYDREVSVARAAGTEPVWSVSLGRDKLAREAPLREAVVRGRITHKRVALLLPAQQPATVVAKQITVAAVAQKLLEKMSLSEGK